MSAVNQDYTVNSGETFLRVFRLGIAPLVSKPVTGVTKAAPPVITAVAHGMVDGWPAVVVSAGGMTQINAANYPPRGSDWHQATFVDSDHVNFNDVNSADYSAYTSGGFLVYPTPFNLTSATGVFTVFDNPAHTGTPLLTITTAPGLVLDNTTKTITVKFATAALSWATGYYELLITDSVSVVRELITGVITIAP